MDSRFSFCCFVCFCVCVCVCVCEREFLVYMVYEDINVYNDTGITA